MPPEYLRIAERGVDGDVFLERDLALHEALPVGAASCNGAPPIVSTGETKKWWSQAGSNRRPPACHAGALPAELWPRFASGRTSCLFFLLDGLADDVGHVGIAFF